MRTIFNHTLTRLVIAALVMVMLVSPVTVYAQTESCSTSLITQWLPILTDCPDADSSTWFDFGDIERFNLLTDDTTYFDDIVASTEAPPFFKDEKPDFATLGDLIERAIVKAPALNAIVEPLELLLTVDATDTMWKDQAFRRGAPMLGLALDKQ